MNTNTQARKIAFSGLILAINALIFLAINYIPTNTLALMALASLLSSIIILEFDLKTGIVFTMAGVVMAFLILTNKLHFFTYLATFGIYGVAKAIIEKKFIGKKQIIIKIIYANLCLIVLFFVSRLFINISLDIRLVLLLLGFEVGFLIYDYFYSQFISFYLEKISKIINTRR